MFVENIYSSLIYAFDWVGYLGGWIYSVSRMSMNSFFNALSNFWTSPYTTTSINLFSGELIYVTFGISSEGYTGVLTSIAGSFFGVIVDFMRDLYVGFGFSLSSPAWLGVLLLIAVISFMFGCFKLVVRVFRH